MTAGRRLPIARGAPPGAEALARAAREADEAVAAALGGAAGLPPGRREVVAAARAAWDALARATASSFARLARERPPGEPWRPACREGCAHCCHQPVAVSFPEALRVAGELGGRAEAVAARAQAAAARVGGLSFEDAWDLREPCPLLDGGRCLAYLARPLACAGYFATDAAACAGGPDAEVGRFAAPLLAASAAAGALRRGVEAAGLDGRRVWLAPTLAALAADPALADRWLAGARLPRHLVEDAGRRIVAPPGRSGA